MTDHTAEAASLSRMLEAVCPRCRQPLEGHEYQLFAQTAAITDRKENLIRFFQFAKTHDWESLQRYQDFDGPKNASEIFALKCPQGDLSMFVVRDPSELFDSRALEAWEFLSSTVATEWNRILRPDGWIAIGAAAIVR